MPKTKGEALPGTRNKAKKAARQLYPDWHEYERRKAEIDRFDLHPDTRDALIRKLATELGI